MPCFPGCIGSVLILGHVRVCITKQLLTRIKWCSPPTMLRHLLLCLWKMCVQFSSLRTQNKHLPLQFVRFLLNMPTYPKCLCISRQGLESLLHHCPLCCCREEETSCLKDWATANLLPLWAKANLGFSSTCCTSCCPDLYCLHSGSVVMSWIRPKCFDSNKVENKNAVIKPVLCYSTVHSIWYCLCHGGWLQRNLRS